MDTTVELSVYEVEVSPSITYEVEVSPAITYDVEVTFPATYAVEVAPAPTYAVEVSLPTKYVEITAPGLQGPPGPTGPPGSGVAEWVSERPAGIFNTINTLFTTSQNFASGSIRLYLNGMRQYLDSFTEIGLNQLDLSFAPYPGDELIVEYIKA